MDQTTRRHLLARLARAQAEGRLPSMVAGVLSEGALAWSAGRGRVGGVRPDDDVQYRIGSITKTFTAVLVLRLRDEGRLDLDDPVGRHLTDCPLAGRTVGQLLAHTGGLRAEPAGSWWERSPGRDWDALAATLEQDPLVFPAGRRFHYSNLGYSVLGRLAASLRGRDWADCVAAEVLAPLEMRRTSPAPQQPAATGFAVHPLADLVLDEQVQGTGAMAPAGELWSTVGDLARFAAMLLGEAPEVLGRDTVEEMRSPGAVDDTRGPWSSYGLGLQVHQVDGRVLVGHGGSMPGFLAGLLVDPAERAGAVVLANSTSGMDATVGTDLLRILRDREPYVVDEWEPAPAPDDETLAMLGAWFWGPTALLLRLSPNGRLELSPVGPAGRAAEFGRVGDRWVGRTGYYAGETLRAVTTPDGRVSHLDIGTFVLTREPYAPGAVIPGGVPEPGWHDAGPPS